MIFRLVFIFLISLCFTHTAYSFVKPKTFDSSYINLEDKILADAIKPKFKGAKSLLSKSMVDTVLKDKRGRVKKVFHIPKYFEPSVKFWFGIYTQFTSHQVVIHDKHDLSVIYNVLDFSALHSSNINHFAKSKLQAHLALEYIRKLKKNLKIMANKSYKRFSAEQRDIYSAIKNSRQKIPKNFKKRKAFFNKLSKTLRTQTGQRNMVYNGVVRSIPYFPFLKKQIKNFGLPEEVLAISFLESSFNPKARSKVAAVGVWQIMPYIGNILMPRKNKLRDYRQNPIVSTIAAFHLIKQNKMLLKRWDLAVPAYNSGTKHIQKAQRKFRNKKKTIDLAYILENYNHPHLGFASKNFYSEFLALVHVLAYKELIYPLKGLESRKKIFSNPANIKIYVSKCSVVPSKFYKALQKKSPKIRDLNSHFNYSKRSYGRGTLVVSDRKLTSKKYHPVSDKQLKLRYPRKYYKYIKNKKCRG